MYEHTAMWMLFCLEFVFLSLILFLIPWVMLVLKRYYDPLGPGPVFAASLVLSLCLKLPTGFRLGLFVCTIASQVDLTRPTLVEPTTSSKTQRMEVRCGLCEDLWT